MTIAETLALAFQQQKAGDLARAGELCRQVLQINPDQADALFLLGTVCLKEGQLDDAVASYQQGLRLQPGNIPALNNLGVAFAYQGKLREAAASYREILRLRPNDAATQNNLGNTLRQLGHFDEAAELLRQAIRLNPRDADAHSNYGHLLFELRNLEGAVASYRRALQFNPNRANTHRCLADVLHEQGLATEALASYQEALRQSPSRRLRLQVATLLPPIYECMEQLRACRQRVEQNIERLGHEGLTIDLDQEKPLPLFYLPYQGFDDRSVQQALAGLHVPPRKVFARPAPRGGPKIRIGFLSRFFDDHTVGELMNGLIAGLSRQTFNVVVFSIASRQDATARFIRSHADEYVELPASLPAARQLVAEHRLDVLFYTDIGMEPMSYGLAFSRLAPVQCVTWGHPVTTGIPTVDYYVSSELFEPAEADRHYSEYLIRLKSLPFYCPRPVVPKPQKGRAEFGLPVDAHLYACPQALFKLHPEFDALLGEILRQDPRGVLLLHRVADRPWDELLRKRFQATIPDVLERVRFLPRVSPDDFMHLGALADVWLDPIHFNGGYTTLKGLALGTPVVTLPSHFLRGRLTLGMYRRMGVGDCVAETPDEYVHLAVRLGVDQDYRQVVRAKILAANDVLYDNAEPVRELESFFQEALARAQVNPGG